MSQNNYDTTIDMNQFNLQDDTDTDMLEKKCNQLLNTNSTPIKVVYEKPDRTHFVSGNITTKRALNNQLDDLWFEITEERKGYLHLRPDTGDYYFSDDISAEGGNHRVTKIFFNSD